jgi:LssY C-terminus
MKIALSLLSGLVVVSTFSFASAVLQPNLEVRLENYLTSYSSPPGTRFRCVVIRAWEVNGHVVIPKGSAVYGRVRKRNSVGIGIIHERAGLELGFEEYQVPDGERFPLNAMLASIDNAREEVTAKGRIKGVLAANNPGNLLNGFWAKPSANIAFRSLIGLTGAANQVWARYSMGPIGAAGLFAARCAVMTFPEPEIYLPPGTDLKLTIQAPPVVESLSPEKPDDELSPRISEALTEWLKDKVGEISYQNGLAAPDLFNVALLGSDQVVISAFTASGWARADRRSLWTRSRVYAAFSARRSYATAPVSRLFYRGEEPDLIFEKSLDTVTQRHHVRFWKIGMFAGQEVWLGAATHDTGVTFKVKAMAFTHKIDPEIDGEREKVATDLSFTECADILGFLNGAPESDAYKDDRVLTDGRIMVMAAQSCMAPAHADVAPGPPGNRFTRLTRRVILETRNYLVRDNAYYWGYQLLHKKSASKAIAE